MEHTTTKATTTAHFHFICLKKKKKKPITFDSRVDDHCPITTIIHLYKIIIMFVCN